MENKREERAATRATRKEYRLLQRTDIKKHRQNKDLSALERRYAIGASRAFHKVGADGKPGGHKAAASYAKKNTEKMAAQTARKAKVTANRSTRVAAAATLKERRTDMNVKRRETSAYKQQDVDFYKRNAKQRGMSLVDYYEKYVQNR